MEGIRVLGVVLAGGSSRRFGADKSAVRLEGKTLLERVIERARPQVDALLVSTNSDIQLPPEIEGLADDTPGEGPLAGILAALDWAQKRDFTRVASFACDTPFFPRDTVARLSDALYQTDADYAVARCGETVHRIFALWPVSCLARLETGFAEGARSMRAIENLLTPAWADFPPEGGPKDDPFFNINTPVELATAQRWLAERQTSLRGRTV